MSIVAEQALHVVVIPAGLTVLALVAARFLVSGPTARARLVALAAGAGMLGALVAIADLPPFPPIDSIGWIHIAVVVAVLAIPLVERGRSDVAVFAILGAVMAYLVGKPLWMTAGAGTTARGMIATAAIVAALVAALSWSAEKLHASALYIALIVVMVGASLSCLFSHSAKLALVCGGFAVVMGTLGVGGLVLGVLPRGRAVAGVVAIAFTGVLLYAHLFASVPSVVVALLVLASVAPVLAALLNFRGRSILAIVLAAGLAAGAVFLAQRAGEAAEGGTGAGSTSDDY